MTLSIACGPEPSPCAGDAVPGSIEEMVDHLGSLPTPVDAACILHSFARPLEVELTNNPFSAQPAAGRGSPRIFVHTGDLTVSLVPTGVGAEVVEFGERVGDTTTLKGELVLPITGPIPHAAPHDRIRGETTSHCQTCHVQESEWPLPDLGTTGFASVAIRPDDDTLFDLDDLRDITATCEGDVAPERCAVLDALFAGEVVHRPFPAHFPTIFDL